MVDPNGENVVETFVTHLQIKKEELDLLPSGFEKEVKIDLSDIHINRAQQIPLSFYRYLYREVGTIVCDTFRYCFAHIEISGFGMSVLITPTRNSILLSMIMVFRTKSAKSLFKTL